MRETNHPFNNNKSFYETQYTKMEKKSERWDLRVQPSLNEAAKELADKLNRSRNSLIENVMWKAITKPELFFVCCPFCNHPQFDVTEIPKAEGVDRIDCDNCGNHFFYDFEFEKIIPNPPNAT